MARTHFWQCVPVCVMMLALLVLQAGTPVQAQNVNEPWRADSLHRNLTYTQMISTNNPTRPNGKERKYRRHIERISRDALKTVFIPKGQWMVGGDISWNEWDRDNLNYVVLKNIDFEGHTFSAGPYFGYFIANNLAMGLRFNYSRYYFNLGKFDLDLGEDLNISLSDLYYLEHNYLSTAFMRSYMPIGQSKVFGFFAELRLTHGYTEGKNTTGRGESLSGTYETINSLQLGMCPGLTVFVTDFMASEVSLNMGGYRVKWGKQRTNNVEEGTVRSSGANFKINLFSINLGLTFYL